MRRAVSTAVATAPLGEPRGQNKRARVCYRVCSKSDPDRVESGLCSLDPEVRTLWLRVDGALIKSPEVLDIQPAHQLVCVRRDENWHVVTGSATRILAVNGELIRWRKPFGFGGGGGGQRKLSVLWPGLKIEIEVDGWIVQLEIIQPLIQASATEEVPPLRFETEPDEKPRDDEIPLVWWAVAVRSFGQGLKALLRKLSPC